MRYSDVRIDQEGASTVLSFKATTRTVGGETFTCRVTLDPLKLHRLMIKAGANAHPHADGGSVGVDLIERKPTSTRTVAKTPERARRKPGQRRTRGLTR